MWVSGRKFSVVRVSAPETSINVPVSATAAKQGVRLTASSGPARPPPDLQQWANIPRYPVQERVGCEQEFGRQVFVGEITRNRPRYLVERIYPRYGGLHLLGQGDKKINPGAMV